ncbi:MAG: hydrogenase expression/formation protein HypE [Cyclobacteriaceae bacterium]|nr:hydrogenase expression/formation protein HypE [Cyclobacteriaceae bacterium]UYN88452.1 MAG: hydrogenase expression/formation protein HypE [Cyclobacteriaceae bacterium]
MQLNCPLPKLDFDVITLGHGSGGVLTHRLLDTGVFNVLKNDLLNEQHDGAILNFSGPVAFTTDSYVVTPIFFPGGNIGELAVNGSINDLAMCGAIPEYLSLSFILEEGLRMEEFWEVLLGIKKASEEAGVSIVTGDTKVVDKGKGDKVFINTTGLGRLHPKANIHANRVKPGDKILVSGPVAQHGVAILSVRQGLEFETTITSDTQSLHRQVIKLLDVLGEDVKFLRDPTRGGVATVLNELAAQSGYGVEIIQKDIPVSEQVEGACELLGLDPLYVANEGIFIAVVAEHKANEALSILKSFHPPTSIIGTVTHEHPKQVIQHSRIGGRRIVSMLPGEQLPRIC